MLESRSARMLIHGRSAKQCYNCQGLGHVQADCPTLRLNGANGRCYNCGQPGHLARNCPAPATAAPRGPAAPRGGFNPAFRGGYGYARTATCYKCGGPNHFARDCQAQAMKCYACGKLVWLLFASPSFPSIFLAKSLFRATFLATAPPPTVAP
ncbi:putative zinc knuckle nucleic acid binding protein [Aspergillus homomorphus CBS 101889]|uniref:CCHC-type domain-containing protein n=1 Tax=Aspergillus homomorphus (strain CBS 101889) TaxID=1450537 RepID=A0A395HN09_ASPHC|nr:hypothetical protein BO97DRAFT_196780 [Aspergillus homomorphus CBS 101889]RAL08655.1 hypothetical protein BO97DRAFT_196780 [Aspergillus homomorphus CBS 101889]